YAEAMADAAFVARYQELLRTYVGRPTPLYLAERLSAEVGHRVYLKREDLAHTGAHKINNALGQALLVQRMGKQRVVAETGAGQHGVATATVCAILGLECVVYMGEEDVHRQAPNVERMRLLGAEVRPVREGSRTLKDAINEAIRDFQAVIGQEARQQIMATEGRLPDCVLACVGGGSNAIGMFVPFVDAPGVELVGVEAGGRGLETGEHAASLSAGSLGVLHGAKTLLLQDEDGQVRATHSVSAGLDYPGVGPEHAYLQAQRRARYVAATDEEALVGFRALCLREGILPALEPAHAIGYLLAHAREWPAERLMIINLSGRGDKDMQLYAEASGTVLEAEA